MRSRLPRNSQLSDEDRATLGLASQQLHNLSVTYNYPGLIKTTITKKSIEYTLFPVYLFERTETNGRAKHPRRIQSEADKDGQFLLFGGRPPGVGAIPSYFTSGWRSIG